MAKTTYLSRILQRPASRARVAINGVVIHDRNPGDKIIGPVAPINHWLIPGENAISITLTPEPRSPLTPYMDAWIRMQIVTADDQDRVLWQWEYPDDLVKLGLPAVLPYVHEGTFIVLDKEHPLPSYLKGTPEEFPAEGTPAMRAAVRELYDAFGTRDQARFEAAMELKSSEFDRYYEPQPRSKAEAMQMIHAPWMMEPFNEEDLRFDRQAGGRVAFARRESGRPAVRAVHRDEPYLGWGTNFYMTCIDGRWRILW